MRMNLLFLLSSDNMGGAEEVMRQIFEYFRERECNIHVFFLLERRYGNWDGLASSNVHLHYSKGGGKLGIFSVLKNFWSVHNSRFDYSFSSIVLCTALIGLMKRLGVLHINHVVGRESTLIFNRFKGLQLYLKKINYNIGYPSVDLLICQTQLMKD